MSKRKDSIDSRYVIVPDQHYEFIDEPAFNCLLRGMEIVRPSGLVNLGDVGEWEHASHWRWQKKKRPPLEYQLPEINKEIAIVNDHLDILDDKCHKLGIKEIHMIEGNHDDWLNDLCVENPFLIDDYSFRNAIRSDGRGYIFHDCGDRMKLGKLYIYHGHLIGGVDHCRNHLIKWGVNILYAHYHDIQQRSVTHVDGEKSAWSIGCLKRFDHEANKFLERRPTNWGHGFAIVDLWDGGYFSVQVIRIIDGRCSIWGELVNGNK